MHLTSTFSNLHFQIHVLFVNRTNIETLKISLEETNSSLAECESRLDDRSKQLEAAHHSLEQLENNLKATKKALQDAQNATLQKDIECECEYIVCEEFSFTFLSAKRVFHCLVIYTLWTKYICNFVTY